MSGDNKLTFDQPTHMPELTLNLIRSFRGHSTPFLKISCKSVQPFSRILLTKKQTKKSTENNTPPRYRGRGNKLWQIHNHFVHSPHYTSSTFLMLSIGLRAQSTLRGKTFLSENMYEKLTKCPYFTWLLPQKLAKYPNFYNIFRKFNNIPEFYIIFARKCPNFT